MNTSDVRTDSFALLCFFYPYLLIPAADKMSNETKYLKTTDLHLLTLLL